MENRELTVDDLSSPVDESMQSEIQPAMSYFAEGGEVEQGLFSQQIPQRPTVQVPQQQPRLKRTAAEMLQRMPQVPLGTMRFSPLSMPGILGRQIPRFAEGGEVDAEQRALMARQMDLGAPTENLFGANLSMPSLPPAVSFETNIPSFTPTYAPPTGPVTTPGTAGTLGQYPGIGGGADLEYQQTLYEQLSPAGLAAPATTFTTATGYTPTAQTTARPTVLSREEAMLKQPTLVRYEPDVKFGGLTTYTGPLQVSPTTGGTDTTKTETGQVKPPLNVDRFALLGFRAPTEGGATGEGKYWFNPSMGYVYVPGGYTPEEGSGWTEVGSEDFLNPPKPEVPINWTDTNFFVTDMYKTPLDQPRVSNLTDVFKLIAGSDVSEAAQNLFKNPSYGWVPDPANPAGGTFSMTPEAVNNIRSSEPFKSAVSDTVKKLYNELGYTVGGEETTSTNVSEKDVANWANAISAGQTDIFRVANTITSPMRMSGQLQLTPDRPTLTSIYVNSGLTIPGHLNKAQIDAAYQKVLGRPADNAGLLFYAADPSVRGKVGSTAALEAALSTSREAQVQAAYRQALGRPADPAGLAYYTSGEGRNVDISAYLPTSREAQVRQAYQQVLGRAADTPGLQYYTSGAGGNIPISDLRTMFGGGERPPAARFRGSPPEGEYADPVAALRERMRMRREAGTMDQGTARDRLKKFLGGEDLAPVRMAEGGDVSRESQVRKVYQDVLGRAADEAGLQYYTTGEGKRYAAAQLADMFGASREGQIQKLYQNVLGRSTDPGGMDYYLRGEGRALTPDQIAESFRGSEEYKSKQRTAAPAAVTTTKGPRPLTREGLLQEAMLFGGNSYNALGAYGPNSLNRRGYLTEKGRQQMINEIQPKAVADLIMRGQSVGLSPDEIQQAVQSGWQRGAESNRDFVVAEREAQANFVPEWFKIASALAGAHMMGTQILNQGASSLAPAASGASVSSASVPVFGTPYTGMELGKIGAAAVQGYQNPNRASAANIVNTVFPSPFGALPRIEDIELFNQGGLVKRKDGSPEYGEIAIGEGGFTKDTLRGLRSGKGGDTFLSDSAKMLRNVFGEGVSNLESVVRGSVAAIPGSAGDIESIFRDDKNRKLATTEEILRDRMPKRMTKPTKEAGGFEEVGTYLPLPVPAGTVSKAAGATKRGAKKALEELGPTTERMLEKAVPKMGIVPEGPFIVLPSKLAEIEKSVLEKRGKAESKRVQKAADEVKNLEDQYTEEALREVFSGDNTNLLMVGNPAEFQEFAAKLEEPYRPAVERYWREMSAQGGGAPSIPFLYINKEKSTLPFISGHEGRHRNIAMQELGYPSTLWRLMPRAALREDLPRRTREEYIKALLDQIGEKPLVIPEGRWTPETRDKDFVNQRVLDWKQARNLPKPFGSGGLVKKAAEALKNLGVKEEKLASKNLTTLQDFSTSLGDRVREGVASKEKIMNAMEFKYAPGQRVFTADSAKKNRLPYEILAKRLYGDQPVRETPVSKASRDPETGKVLRTPYEPGYLVRQDHGNGEFSEYVLPESAIKGAVDKFFTGGAVKKPTTTSEPETSGMLSQASRFFKDLIGTAPVPSTLNMTPYESMYAFKDVGSPEKGRKAALNVYSSLLPALMRARFPDYVANSPATVLKEVPRAPTNIGEFDVFYRTIALDPGGVNSMLMEPYGKQGYIGMGSDTTTEDTLNALGTMLHESMHARTRGAKGKTRSVAHPAEQLKKSMATDRFDEMIRDIRISELPSVYSARSPVEVINEYFATATPIKQMADKDMLTRRTRSQLKEVDRLAKKYPELEKMRVNWERPEVFLKD